MMYAIIALAWLVLFIFICYVASIANKALDMNIENFNPWKFQKSDSVSTTDYIVDNMHRAELFSDLNRRISDLENYMTSPQYLINRIK